MTRSQRTLGLILLLTVLLGQFTNCSKYVETNTESYVSKKCVTADCVDTDQANMKIIVNLDNADFKVSPGLAEFNLGGDCNEGGFVRYNVIKWSLSLQGQGQVRTSDHKGMNVSQPSASVNSACVNGRFLLYLNLRGLASPYDTVDRTGLRISGATRGAYDLTITLYGSDKAIPALVPVGTPSVQTLVRLTPQL